jgi:hypothetical protein
MWPLFAVGILAGMLLGLRYKVLVLLPAIAAACALTILGALFGNGVFGELEGFAVVVLPAVIVSGALQVGYFCGLFLRLIIVPEDSARPQTSAQRPTWARGRSRH